MENYNVIIAGVIGSAITLLITAILDYLKVKYISRIEMKKLIFQRQTDAVEKAISWYQEAIDCYSIMQMACVEINDLYNHATWLKFTTSSIQANKLYSESHSRLNQIYLYYDFSDITMKHNTLKSTEYINYAFSEISKLYQQILALEIPEGSDKSEEIKKLQAQAILLFRELSKAIDAQINSNADIQKKLRDEYLKYKK